MAQAPLQLLLSDLPSVTLPRGREHRGDELAQGPGEEGSQHLSDTETRAAQAPYWALTVAMPAPHLPRLLWRLSSPGTD